MSFNVANYLYLQKRYIGTVYNDSNEFIGTEHFGICKDLYEEHVGSSANLPKRDIIVKAYMEPFFDENTPHIDWRSVGGTQYRWQHFTSSKVGRVKITSIRKLCKNVAIDYDFCKVFTNHWFQYCADPDFNKDFTCPVYAHNKTTYKLEGYIFPVLEYTHG